MKLKELFGIDLRSLALFRICLGLIILIDLLTRLPDLNTFYTDAGLLPRAALVGQPQLISAHLMNGTVWFQAVLFLIQGVCAVGLLVGYRTRLMTWLSWVLMVSLHWRFRSILGGGDEYLRYLLFWSVFLPLGARWSVDRALDDSVEPGRRRRIVPCVLTPYIPSGILYSRHTFYRSSLKLHKV